MFRGDMVGTDHPGYIDVFKSITKENALTITALTRTELGYLYQMILFKFFSDNYVLFFGIQYLFFFIGFWRYCRYKKADTAWTLMLFFFIGFYLRSFNAIRQFAVIGMILFFFPWLEERKYIRFSIIIIFISVFFHTSELVYLVLILVHYYISKNKSVGKLYPLAALLLSYSLFFMNHSFIYNIQLPGLMGERFDAYFESGETREEIGYMTAGVYTLYALIILYCANMRKYAFEVYTIILSVIIFNIGNIIHITIARLSLDFMIVICPLSSLMIFDNKTKKRFVYALTTVVVCIALFVVQFVISNNSDVKPYYYAF